MAKFAREEKPFDPISNKVLGRLRRIATISDSRWVLSVVSGGRPPCPAARA